MRPSQKRLLVAGAGLAGLLLILSGESFAQTSDWPRTSLAASQFESCTRLTLAASPVASNENDSNGKGELEEQLKLLLEELKGLEKDAKEKFRNEILPYLKREIEKLRDRLKEFSPDKEEAPQPQRIGT